MTLIPDELRNTITCADALAFLKTLPDESVNCVICSPPYYSQRDYKTATWQGGDPNCAHAVGRFETPVSVKQRSNHGSGQMQARSVCPKCGAVRVDQQIGLETSLSEYIDKLITVFHEMQRVMRDDAVFWLNIGDTFAGGNRGGNPAESAYRKQATNRGSLMPPVPKQEKLPPKSLMLVPHRVAIALQDDGWIIRQDNIWHRPNQMPGSQRDRPTTAHEHVFMLTKKPKYFYDEYAVREKSSGVGGGGWSKNTAAAQVNHGGDHFARPEDDGTRTLRSVWEISTEPSRAKHYAAFPTKLVKVCLKAGCPETVCAVCGKPYVRETRQTGMPSMQRPQGLRALEIFQRSGLTDDHLAAIRAVGMADTGKALVTMTGAGKNADEIQRLAAEAKKVLGGYYREFVFGIREDLGLVPACACDGETRRGIVLDPFIGSGRTAITALRLNRDYIGCDLNPEYVAMARDAVRMPHDERETVPDPLDLSKMPLFSNGSEHDG